MVLHRRVLEARVTAPCPCAARRSTLGDARVLSVPRRVSSTPLSCNTRRRESCAELAISCSAVARYDIHAHSLQRLRGGALGARALSTAAAAWRPRLRVAALLWLSSTLETQRCKRAAPLSRVHEAEQGLVLSRGLLELSLTLRAPI